jgi:hypothetical protein
MATAEVAQPLEHSYAIPDPLPPGNYVAKQLRFVNEDSTNLFPKSAGSRRSYPSLKGSYRRFGPQC